jgi:hypothetical protein
MERRSVEAIVEALDAAGIRYLIVGGTAVAAHGYVRFTADIDIVLDPAPAALQAAIEALRATFVCLADLLDMKRAAGRPQDRQDLEALLALPPPEGDANE